MPGQPKWSSCVSGNALLPISVVTTGSRPSSASSAQLGAGVGVERAAADVEHGPLGPRDRRAASRIWRGWPALRRLPAGQVDLVRVLEVERRLLDVARDVDEHGPAAARSGRRGRPPSCTCGSSSTSWTSHECLTIGIVMPGDVALLERVGADQVRRTWPGDADERRRVHPRVGDRRSRGSSRPAPEVAIATPTRPDARA